MIFSALVACCSCFSSSGDSTEPAQNVETSNNVAAKKDVRWSMASSDSYFSSTSIARSLEGNTGESRANPSHCPARHASLARRSAMSTPTGYAPHRMPSVRKHVHWAASLSIHEENAFSSPSKARKMEGASRSPDAKKERLRGKEPLSIRTHAKRPSSGCSVVKKTSLILPQSPLSPKFCRGRRHSREVVLYPAVEKPIRAASVLDVYQHKQTLLAAGSRRRTEEVNPASPRREKKKWAKKHPPISPSASFVEQLKKDLAVFDTDPPIFDFTVYVKEER